MGSQRWDPWSDIISLREAMTNLLEESFVRSGDSGRSGVGLAVDVLETPDAYEIYGSVPGMAPEDVEISVLGDTMTIRGDRRSISLPEEGEGTHWLIRERHAGGFSRTITLPTAVRAEDASAEFRDGVLTVRLPKAEEVRGRTIPVRFPDGRDTPKAIDVGEE
jgi:HSP20 family protein